MGFLKDTAGALIGGIGTIGGWLGIGEGRQDKRQVNQQTKLNAVNEATSKRLADYEQDLKLKMWKDTNYGAQLEQAAQAGVSKAAAIGGSGTGTQGASVNGVSGTGAADAASTTNARTAQMQAGMQLASQLALQKAQKENIEADTANKLAGEGLAKEDLEKRKMDTLTQGAEYTKKIAESQEANRGLEDRLTKLKAEGVGAGIENEAKKIGIKVDKAKIEQMAAQVAQGWKNLDQGEQKLKIDKFKAEIDANYPGLGGIAGKVVDNVLERGYEILKGKKKEGTYKIK